MVAEHIADPNVAAHALSRACAGGGRVVIYTVYKWSPVTMISAALPLAWHYRLKRVLWRTEEKDTFPTVYRMNTREHLRRTLAASGFEEEHFAYLDDCRSFSRWKFTNVLELSAWKTLQKARLHYPEVCLLGVYRKCL
jgi:hypothetical protein